MENRNNLERGDNVNEDIKQNNKVGTGSEYIVQCPLTNKFTLTSEYSYSDITNN